MIAAARLLQSIDAALSPHGIFARGVVRFSEADIKPVLASGETACSVVLIGNIGGSLWEPFSRWRALADNAGRADPLDDWSKALIRPLAETLGATAYFPSDPPWQPFQQWAMRAEGLRASPLGVLIHPEYGLWHGYRGALGLALPIDDREAAVTADHPCDHCPDKPCLSSCPVDAVSAGGFDVAACRSHLRRPAGQAGCMAGGCMARAACPVGREHRYPLAQLAFHMAALRL